MNWEEALTYSLSIIDQNIETLADFPESVPDGQTAMAITTSLRR